MLFILCILVLIYYLYQSIRNDECFFPGILAIFGGALCLPLSLFTEHEVYRTNHQKPIFSLKTDKGVQGSFFLGTGHINSTNSYFYYVKDSRGGYIMDSSSIYGTYLFEVDKKEPSISWQNIHYDVSRWVLPFSTERTQDTKYDLTVPVGTIVKEYHGF